MRQLIVAKLNGMFVLRVVFFGRPKTVVSTGKMAARTEIWLRQHSKHGELDLLLGASGLTGISEAKMHHELRRYLSASLSRIVAFGY